MTRPFRFLHAADVHLDSPLKGLASYQGAPESIVRFATRRSLERVIDLAMKSKVDFVLVSGDLYDGTWPDQSTGLFFSQQMSRLRQESIPVFIIRGNHDAASRVTDRLRLPENVSLLDPGVVSRCDNQRLNELGVCIVGHSYATPAVNESVIEHFPLAKPGEFTIGMLHTAVEGNQLHQRYAPCSVGDLVSKGYNYWALGHVHQRQTLNMEPPVVFPGNIQGRHIRETGAKGCYVVEVDEHHNCKLHFHSTDVIRWHDLEVVIDGEDYVMGMEQLFAWLNRFLDHHVETREEFQDLANVTVHIAEPDARALRLTLLIDPNLESEFYRRIDSVVTDVRSHLTDYSCGKVWLEKVKIKSQNPVAVSGNNSDAAELMRAIANAAAGDHELLGRCRTIINDLLKKLPTESVQRLDLLRTDNGALGDRLEALPELIAALAENKPAK